MINNVQTLTRHCDHSPKLKHERMEVNDQDEIHVKS